MSVINLTINTNSIHNSIIYYLVWGSCFILLGYYISLPFLSYWSFTKSGKDDDGAVSSSILLISSPTIIEIPPLVLVLLFVLLYSIKKYYHVSDRIIKNSYSIYIIAFTWSGGYLCFHKAIFHSYFFCHIGYLK